MILCACGCGEPTEPATQTSRSRGLAKGQPQKYLRGHARRVGKAPVRDVVTGCLVWQGKPSAQGYGRTSRRGITRPAHVALWEDQNGPVPVGMEIDHKCYNRMCVNLDHLECVTRAENRRRASLRRWHG